MLNETTSLPVRHPILTRNPLHTHLHAQAMWSIFGLNRQGEAAPPVVAEPVVQPATIEAKKPDESAGVAGHLDAMRGDLDGWTVPADPPDTVRCDNSGPSSTASSVVDGNCQSVAKVSGSTAGSRGPSNGQDILPRTAEELGAHHVKVSNPGAGSALGHPELQGVDLNAILERFRALRDASRQVAAAHLRQLCACEPTPALQEAVQWADATERAARTQLAECRPTLVRWWNYQLATLGVDSCVWVVCPDPSTQVPVLSRYRVMDVEHGFASGRARLLLESSGTSFTRQEMLLSWQTHYSALTTRSLAKILLLPSPVGDEAEKDLVRALLTDDEWILFA